MAEDGLQDFVGLLNVTLNAVGAIGSVGMAVTKGSVKLASRLVKLFSCMIQKISDREYQKTGGKVKNKVLQVKYNDLMYSSIKTSNIEAVKQKAIGMGANPSSLTKLNEKDLLKEFDKIAKKVGFPYSEIPNFVKDAETGKIEYRLAFSKQHQEAYNEAVAQFNSMISIYLNKEVGIKDKKVCNEMADSIMKEGNEKSLTEAIGEIGLLSVSDEQFEIEMKESFPNYNPKLFEPVEPSDEKKTDCVLLIEENEYRKEKEHGNIKKIVITEDRIKARLPEERAVIVQLEQYPNVTVKIKEEDFLRMSAGAEVLDGHGQSVRKEIILEVKKSSKYDFEVFLVNPNTKDVDMENPKRYSMPFEEFERLMSANEKKSKEKVASLGLPDKSALPDIVKKTGRNLKK